VRDQSLHGDVPRGNGGGIGPREYVLDEEEEGRRGDTRTHGQEERERGVLESRWRRGREDDDIIDSLPSRADNAGIAGSYRGLQRVDELRVRSGQTRDSRGRMLRAERHEGRRRDVVAVPATGRRSDGGGVPVRPERCRPGRRRAVGGVVDRLPTASVRAIRHEPADVARRRLPCQVLRDGGERRRRARLQPVP